MVNLSGVLFVAVVFEVSSVAEGFAYSPALSNIKSGLLKLKLRAVKAKIPSVRSSRKLLRSADLQRQLRDDLMLDVARSFKKLTGFIAREAEKANDDLLLSLRITQGQLTQLLAEAPGVHDGSETAQLLRSAMEDLTRADDVLFPNFEAKTLLSEDFSFMMARAVWDNLPQQDARFAYPNFESVWAESYARHRDDDEDDLKFSEEASDACLGELKPRQNSLEASHRSLSCAISDRCWRMMSKPDMRGYELTHQLLFLSLGRSAGCGPDLERLARRDFAGKLPRTTAEVTPELMRHQCRRVLDEARAIAKAAYPDEDKDLFLEQGMLCGAAVRMPEFFEPAMIRSAMSWQKSSGCYGFVDVDAVLNNLTPEQKAAHADELGLKNLSDDIIKGNRRDLLAYPQGRKGTLYNHLVENDSPRRVRLFAGDAPQESLAQETRREKIMSRSCLSHNSAVAMGYLGVAMRYLAAESDTDHS